MWSDFSSWVYSFVSGCGELWTWLLTDISITNDLTVKPLYLVCGGVIIIGILRAIL